MPGSAGSRRGDITGIVGTLSRRRSVRRRLRGSRVVLGPAHRSRRSDGSSRRLPPSRVPVPVHVSAAGGTPYWEQRDAEHQRAPASRAYSHHCHPPRRSRQRSRPSTLSLVAECSLDCDGPLKVVNASRKRKMSRPIIGLAKRPNMSTPYVTDSSTLRLFRVPTSPPPWHAGSEKARLLITGRRLSPLSRGFMATYQTPN